MDTIRSHAHLEREGLQTGESYIVDLFKILMLSGSHSSPNSTEYDIINIKSTSTLAEVFDSTFSFWL